VDEYQDQFLKLLARCDGITERQQIDIFTAGLGNLMCIDVEMQKPESFEDAMTLARAYERRLAIDDNSSGALVPARTTSHPAGRVTPPSPNTPSKPGNAGRPCQSPAPWRSIHALDA